MKLPVWSYSFLDVYERCPKQAQAKYVDRNYPYETESQALKWGNAVHSAMEHRINDKTPLPQDMQHWDEFAKRILGAPIPVRAELKLGVNKQYEPCGFFGDEVYGRGKLDVVLLGDDFAVLYDWKTGKSTYEDPLELKVGAVLLQALYPQMKEIVGAYVWLKEDRWGKLYDLSDTDGTREWIDQTMDKAAKSNFWTPKRNALCSWCALKDCPNFSDRKNK